MSDNPTPSKCECCKLAKTIIRLKHPREEHPDIFLCQDCLPTHNLAFAYGVEWGKVDRVASWKGRELKEQPMSDKPKECCGECRYYYSPMVMDYSGKPMKLDHGVCRQSPRFEEKLEGDWCGKYRPKPYEPGERK